MQDRISWSEGVSFRWPVQSWSCLLCYVVERVKLEKSGALNIFFKDYIIWCRLAVMA